MLLVEVVSVMRKLSNSLCPAGRIHHRTCECKVEEKKYKREHGGAQVKYGG
jgi:hypothetical protein